MLEIEAVDLEICYDPMQEEGFRVEKIDNDYEWRITFGPNPAWYNLRAGFMPIDFINKLRSLVTEGSREVVQ